MRSLTMKGSLSAFILPAFTLSASMVSILSRPAHAAIISRSDEAEIRAGILDNLDAGTEAVFRISPPSDGRLYRFVRKEVKFLEEKDAKGRIEEVRYDPEKQVLTAKLKVEGCWTGIGRFFCPDVRVRARLTAYFEQDAADPAPGIPDELETVGEAVQAYSKRNAGLEREIRAEQDRRESLLREFREKLKAKIEAERGAEVSKIASRKSELARFEWANQAYLRQVSGIAADYTAFMGRYQREYPASASEINRALQALSTEASTSDLEAIPVVALRFSSIEQRDWQLAADYTADARELEARFRQAHAGYLDSIRELRDFLAEARVEPADAVAVPLQSLSRVREACDNRARAFSSQIRLVIEALNLRERNLLARRIQEATSEDIARARRLEAAARFTRELREAASAAWTAPRQAVGSGMAFLGEDLQRKRELLNLRLLCSENRPEWAHTGCMTAAPDFERTQTYVHRTVFRKLRQGVGALRALGRPDVLPAAERIEASLAAGRALEAALEWDQVLRMIEAKP